MGGEWRGRVAAEGGWLFAAAGRWPKGNVNEPMAQENDVDVATEINQQA